MRKLTLEGFLMNYVKELSLENTLNILKLEDEVIKNVRLKQVLPLLLLIDDTKRLVLENKFPDSINLKNMRILETKIKHKSLYDYLLSDQARLEYKKILESYLVEKTKKNTEFDRKELYLKRIKEIRENKKISDYKIYKTLKINNGNFHSFYNKGEVNKLALNKVREVFEYVSNY